MSDKKTGTATATSQQPEQQRTSTSVYRDTRDPLRASLSWSSIKTAWKDLKTSL